MSPAVDQRIKAKRTKDGWFSDFIDYFHELRMETNVSGYKRTKT